ncbi:MAG: lipopolysaccharide biosynthesis protein [Mediterranea sp.]|nr:lipopolysaccharide biosynthesis protein [Mediterranea sp.]
MSTNLKSLAKDTAIYGASSIVGRFLNYLLVPLYTAVLSAASGGYGVVSNVYAYTALILVLLTFGMETGFFRFANKSDEDPMKVYANSLISVGGLSLIFVLSCLLFLRPIADALEYGEHPEYIAMMAVVVALDAFQCIPFAYLRYKKRPIKFASVKLLNIAGSIGLNCFFLLLCPWLHIHSPELIAWFYDPDYLVGYIFVSNLIASTVQLFFFIPELRGFAYRIDKALLKRMVVYSFPLLVLGVVGILNQSVDKIIFPYLFADHNEGFRQLGIYGAATKIALVLAMFTQAFRYAYEPFVFGKARDGKANDNIRTQAAAMKYFLIFAFLAYLAILFYLDLFRYLIGKDYWDGLRVVGIVMGAEVCKGIYFNLSFWYKLTDATRWGAYFAIVGCAIIVSMNILLVPLYGYVASAWASVAGYGVIVLLSYWMGQKKYPIPYDLKGIGRYLSLAAALGFVGMYLPVEHTVARLAIRTALLLLFVAYILKTDLPPNQIPLINRFIKKR